MKRLHPAMRALWVVFVLTSLGLAAALIRWGPDIRESGWIVSVSVLWGVLGLLLLYIDP